MTSKILIAILIGCAVVSASPINRSNETEEEVFGGIAGIIKTIFGKLLEKIGETIRDSVQTAFGELSKRLDSEVYREAITELKNILKTVYGDEEEPNVGEEDKKVIEEELEKVGAAFVELVEEVVKGIKNNSDEKVDAAKFKEAVENLKKVVDQIYANQGTN